MPTPDFFIKHGLFAVKYFIDRDFCHTLCDDIRFMSGRGVFQHGTILGDPTEDFYIDKEIKHRTESTQLSVETIAKIREKLLDLMPHIGRHFNVKLEGCQDLKFAVYSVGDYFKQHVDRVADERAPQEIKERKVSVVVFLNDESEQPAEGTYGGGRLTFYDLLNNSPFASFGFPLEAEAGTLIAFPPTLRHEVTPVTHGVRYVIVTWYK